jgi:hypothetical protein
MGIIRKNFLKKARLDVRLTLKNTGIDRRRVTKKIEPITLKNQEYAIP